MPRFPFALSRRYIFSLMLILLAGGGLWYWRAAANAAAAGPGSAVASTAEAPAGEPQDGSKILLGLARAAMRDGRLVAPTGSNAYEFYLSVLQLQPDNRAAQEALRESFPLAAEEIERTINRGDLDEARRELDLLHEFDSTNFTLALLGGKLAAARNIVTKQHEAEAERIRQSAARRAAVP